MGEMVEPDIDVLHGQVVGDDAELPTGGGEASDEPDQGDEDSKPEDFDG
jgi:hypothetical protein